MDRAAVRAAALLRGGMPPARLWIALGEQPQAPPELAGIAERIALGVPIADAIAATGGPAWRASAAVWEIAEQSGAPLADVLERLAFAIRALERAAQRRSVLLSGPRATIRLVLALPPVVLLLGALLGFDPLPVLTGPLGAPLLAGGALLLGLGAAWSHLLVDRVARAEQPAAWSLELSRVSLGGGGPSDEALRRVADSADRLGAEWVRLSDLRSDGPVRVALQAAESLGSPAGPLLLGAAESARRQAEAGFEQAAERLAVRVLVPLGACVLPAFVLLGVAPVVVSMLGGAAF